jgi:c-di-GMP phosphodiesterase
VTDAILARQPIFDHTQARVGFELLFRGRIDATTSEGSADGAMVAGTVLRAVLGIGLDRLSEGTRVWINCTREFLVSRSWRVLDPSRVMLEVLETVVPDHEVIAACEEANARGYHLALDDFVFGEEWLPLLALAKVVKVDVLDRSDDDLETLVRQLRAFPVVLLAEKVETDDVRLRCARLGFELFQGYFYKHPETVVQRDLQVSDETALQLLSIVRNDDSTAADIEQAVKRDPGLVLKLLQIVNSALVGAAGVESIRHAVSIIGRSSLERWLVLLVMARAAKAGGRQREQFTLSLTRARLLETLSGPDTPSQRFFAGLLSMLPAMLQRAPEETIPALQLAPPVENALLRREGPLGELLSTIELHEAGRWDGIDAAQLEAIGAHYPAALQWALDQVALTI